MLCNKNSDETKQWYHCNTQLHSITDHFFGDKNQSWHHCLLILFKLSSKIFRFARFWKSLQGGHNGRDGVSNHQPHHCLLNRLFGRRSKLSVTGLCGEFPTQRASNAENVYISWRHPVYLITHAGIFFSSMAAGLCSTHYSIRFARVCVHVTSELILGLRPANERRCYFVTTPLIGWAQSGPILGLRPANERRCYIVTTSLIGWAQA